MGKVLSSELANGLNNKAGLDRLNKSLLRRLLTVVGHRLTRGDVNSARGSRCDSAYCVQMRENRTPTNSLQ